MAYNITGVEEFDHKRTKVTLDYGEVAFLLYKGECRRFGIGVSGSKQRRKSGGRNLDEKGVDTAASEWRDRSLCDASMNASMGKAYPVRESEAEMNPGSAEDCNTRETGRKETLSDEEYAAIRDEILIPRAKKRVLYYMKNADKTRGQILKKLKEGFYPDEVIDAVMEFLDHYGFANDQTYAESYIEQLRGSYSRREIEAKLMQRGLKPQDVRLSLEALTEEDELSACRKALRKKYPGRPAGAEDPEGFDEAEGGLTQEDPDYSDNNGGLSPEERQKAYAYLARKGFSSAAIREALDAWK